MSFYNRLNLKNGDVFTASHLGCLESGIQENEIRLNDFDATVRSINHRGYSVDAPENTLPAFKMAVDRGFGFECDIYISRMCSPGRATLLETGRDEWRKK